MRASAFLKTSEEGKGGRQSLWYQVKGTTEYQERAFNLAHEIDPNAHLIYNDYNMHDPGKREFVVQMLKDYKRRGVPIHGVGMQSHVGLDWPDMQEYEIGRASCRERERISGGEGAIMKTTER